MTAPPVRCRCSGLQEAIEEMKALAHLRPTWIEEPLSPDDIYCQGRIAAALRPLGIVTALGEQCSNKVHTHLRILT